MKERGEEREREERERERERGERERERERREMKREKGIAGERLKDAIKMKKKKREKKCE